MAEEGAVARDLPPVAVAAAVSLSWYSHAGTIWTSVGSATLSSNRLKQLAYEVKLEFSILGRCSVDGRLQ